MITVGDMVSRPGVQDPKTSSSWEPPRAGEVLASGRVLSQLHLSTAEPLLPPRAPPQGLPTQGSASRPSLSWRSSLSSPPWLSAPHPPPGPAKPAGPSRFSVSQLLRPSPTAPRSHSLLGSGQGHLLQARQSASLPCVSCSVLSNSSQPYGL